MQTIPHDSVAERTVLGAILLRNELLVEALAYLNPGDFYEPCHRAVFSAMQTLGNAQRPIDAVTVWGELQTSERASCVEGGISYLIGLFDDVPSSENAPTYIATVSEKSNVRQLAALCDELRARARGDYGDYGDFMAHVQSEISKITNRTQRLGYESLGSVMVRSIEAIIRVRKGEVSGIPTGFIDLDAALGGLRDTELVLIAGRPAMGKTSLAMNIAANIAKTGIPVLAFSLEMGSQQLAERLLASEAKTDLADLRRGCVSNPEGWRRVMTMAPQISQTTRMWLDENTAPTIAEMRARASCWASKETKGKGLVVVDYVQLVRGGSSHNESRQQQLGEVSRGLKNMAKDLKMPVVALAQLNRECEKREDKRPLLSDLREAGDFENDADIVLMLYRDEVYDAESTDKGTAEGIIRKHRNGAVGTVKLAWNGSTTSFSNLSKWNGNGYSKGHFEEEAMS